LLGRDKIRKIVVVACHGEPPVQLVVGCTD
jgi:hypothetical protein